MAKSKNNFIYSLLNDEVHNIAKLAYDDVKEFKYTTLKGSGLINIDIKTKNDNYFFITIDDDLNINTSTKSFIGYISTSLPNSMKVHKYIIELSNKYGYDK